MSFTMSVFLGILCLLNGVSAYNLQEYNIDNNTNVEFLLSFRGYEGGNSDSTNLMFSSALNNNNILDTYNSSEECKSSCAYSEDCLGIFEMLTPNYFCNTLNNLGIPITSNYNSNSFKKITTNLYQNGNNSLTVYFYDSSDIGESSYNTTIYIDLNHNGILDDGEPYNSNVRNGESITFNNLEEGMYLVRQVIPEGCSQFWPGINSSFSSFKGDGFIDRVSGYIHYGHSNHSTAHGSIINSNIEYLNNNFSFIIGENPNTYLSFYNNYSITLAFVDDTVINQPGDDFYIDLYDYTSDSKIIANVSVSSDDIHYKFIGQLNYSNVVQHGNHNRVSFDLSDGNFNHSVVYIRINFNGTDNEKLNIVRVGIYEQSLYKPPYAYLVQIPQERSYFFSYDIMFLNDCHYIMPCESYCAYNIFYDDDWLSCLEGCKIFDQKQNCNCEYYDGPENFWEDLNDDYWSGNYGYDWSASNQIGDGNFNQEMCEHGCDYHLKQHIYPNYTLIDNSIGNYDNLIDENVNKSLDMLISMCNNNKYCGSIALKRSGGGNLYDSHNHNHNHSYAMIARNEYETQSATSTTTSSSLSSTTSSSSSSTTSSHTTSTSTTSSSLSSTTSSSSSSKTSSTATSLNSDNNMDPSSNRSSSSWNDNTYVVFSIVLAILVLSGLVVGIYFVIQKKKQRTLNYDRNTTSYYNPLYGSKPEENIDSINPSEFVENIDSPDASNYQDVNSSDTFGNTFYSDEYLEFPKNSSDV